MNKYFLRFITAACTDTAEKELTAFLKARFDAQTEPIRPYWKNPGQGEMLCQISSAEPMLSIQAVLADSWEAGTADARWSRIHAPHTVFIWVST